MNRKLIQTIKHPATLFGVLFLSSVPFLMVYRHLGWSLENIWILMFPLGIYIARKGETSWRMLGLLIPCLVFHLCFHSSFGLYMVVFTFGMLILETSYGKLNISAPIILLLSTPLVVYSFEAFGFPIRTSLSHAAVGIINLFGPQYEAQGSIIRNDAGLQFSVDQACSGLKMVITGFSIQFLLLAHLERKRSVQLKGRGVVISMLVTSLIIFGANLLRIIVLVVLQLPSEDVLHEWVGVGMIFFFFLLIYLSVNHLLKYQIMHLPWEQANREGDDQFIWGRWQWPAVILMSAYLLWYTPGEVFNGSYLVNHLQYEGYSQQVIEGEILELLSSETVVYIKPNKGVFRVDHQPMICWKGSGFELVNMQRREVYGDEVYFGNLKREGEALFTAWWYDNGNDKTTSQWVWRKNMLLGKSDYKLVNVTARTESELMEHIGRMFKCSPMLAQH